MLTHRIAAAALAFCAMSGAASVSAGEYCSIGENGTVLYDAPSTRAKKMFVASRYYPVEIMVNIDQWARVRDVAGDLVWVEKKALAELRTVVVTAATAEIRDKLFGAGVETVGSTPAEFAAEIRADIARLAKVIKDANIRAE